LQDSVNCSPAIVDCKRSFYGVISEQYRHFENVDECILITKNTSPASCSSSGRTALMLQSRTRVDHVNPKQFPQKNQVWAEFNGRRTTLCTSSESAWSGGESKEGNKLCKCRSPTDRSGFCYSTRMPKIIKSEPAETTIVCGQL